MRMALRVAVAIWALLGVLAFVYLTLGLPNAPLETVILFLPGYVLIELSGAMHGTFADSAHGPAFLTVPGILLWYGTPVMVALGVAYYGRSAHRRKRADHLS